MPCHRSERNQASSDGDADWSQIIRIIKMHSSKPSARASLLKNLTFLSSFIQIYVCVFSCVLPVTYLKHSSTTAALKSTLLEINAW
jgi:hypothetical protein